MKKWLLKLLFGPDYVLFSFNKNNELNLIYNDPEDVLDIVQACEYSSNLKLAILNNIFYSNKENLSIKSRIEKIATNTINKSKDQNNSTLKHSGETYARPAHN